MEKNIYLELEIRVTHNAGHKQVLGLEERDNES